MKKIFFAVAILCLSAFSADPSEKSDFEMDKDLVNTLYRESMTEAKVEKYTSSGIVIRPTFSYVSPQKFELSNDYYTVPYAADGGSLPTFRLEVGKTFAAFSGVEMSGLISAGYSYRESLISVSAKSGKKFSDLLKVHSLPLNAGVQLDYRIPGVSFIKPGISSSVGFMWFYQTGKLDGIEQGFWIPSYQLSAHLNLFEGLTKESQWFNGVQLGSTLFRSFASAQVFEAWSIDLGVGFTL